jgi:lysophospholipase L1-like esterase
MKNGKNVLFILISALFVASIFYPTSFPIYAKDDAAKTMLAFGDSITAGYGVGEENGYVRLFADEREYALTNYAVNGWKSYDLLALLESGDCGENIANADLITICIGANDILSLLNILAYRLSTAVTTEQINAIMADAQSSEFTTGLQNAVDNFKENFQKTTEYFSDTDARVIFLTVYNPYSGVIAGNPMLGVTPFNLGLLAEIWIEKLNNTIKEQKDFFDLYRIIENYSGEDKLIAVDFNATPINPDPHPTLKGQQYIASQFSLWFNSESFPQNTPATNNSPPVWNIILISINAIILLAIIVLYVFRKNVFDRKRN